MPEGSIPCRSLSATRQGWPAIAPCIGAVIDQVRDVGGELIVVDASGREAPDLGSPVRWLPQPTSMSVFQLRQVAYEESRGEIVAATEDHCRVMAGWCRRILDLHAAHPEAAAIGGALENGTTSSLIDWAAFIVTQAPAVAPLPSGPVQRTTGAANVSLKRRAVERLPSHDGFGTIELFDTAEVAPDGEVLLQDDSLVVLHDQSMGFIGTSAIEFHNGRTIGGIPQAVHVRSRLDEGRRRRRAPAVSIDPDGVDRVARTNPETIPHRGNSLDRWLEYCTGVGQLLGYATGPGDSPSKLR